jgi:hypothetical protein
MPFIAIHDKLRRLRVNGEATVRDEDPQMAEIVGAQLVVRVVAQAIFRNCPRPIPTMQMVEPSIYAPRLAVTPQSRLGRRSRTARNMRTRAGRLLEVVANRSPAGERDASAGA